MELLSTSIAGLLGRIDRIEWSIEQLDEAPMGTWRLLRAAKACVDLAWASAVADEERGDG